MVVPQGQMTAMNNLLQLMVFLQVNAASSSFQSVKQVDEIGCMRFGSPHKIDACPLNIEIVAYVKHDPYSNTYNPRWRNHPNFVGRTGSTTSKMTWSSR